MMGMNEIYASAVLMCLDDLRIKYFSKKEQLVLKYANNQTRVSRALSRFVYQLPSEVWEPDDEKKSSTYFKAFVGLNEINLDPKELIWEKQLDWQLVVALFRDVKASAPKKGIKAYYRAKITAMMATYSQVKPIFNNDVLDFCVKQSFLSTGKSMHFCTDALETDLGKKTLVFSNETTRNKFSTLYYCWEHEFSKTIETQFYYKLLPSKIHFKECVNYLLDFSGIDLDNALRLQLEDAFRESFPDHKYAVSRRDEVLLLNYFVANASPDSSLAVLVSSSFLNRLGVDQFYREFLLSTKRVHTVLALPPFFSKGLESYCLLVLKGLENNEVQFVDGRQKFLKKDEGFALDVKALADLFKTESDFLVAQHHKALKQQQSRLDPSVYLALSSSQRVVKWKEIVALEARVASLSKALEGQLKQVAQNPKPKKFSLAEDLMCKTIVDTIPVFSQLADKELLDFAKRILKVLPKMNKMSFLEFIDDTVYELSDRFNLDLDFDALDALAENILKKKSRF